MTILKFELQKILKWKGLYIAAVLLILINALYIFSTKPSSLSHYRSAYRYYKAEEGYVTAEKIRMAEEGMKELNKLYHDGIRFDEKNLGKSILYRDINTVVAQRNQYVKVISDLENNEAKSEKEILILKLLKNVGPLDSVYYTEGWKEITKFTWSIGYYFTILLILLGVSLIIPQEYATGMYMIVNSTKESKSKLIYGKISVVIVFAGIVTALFAVINVLANWYIYGLAGWNAPLKCIYYNTPYNIKIWQFFLIQQIFHILSVSVLGLLTLLISIFTKKSIIALSLGGIVFIIFNEISRLIGDKAAQSSISFIISDFIDLRGIFTSYKNIYRVFNFSIQYEVVLAAIIIILLILMMGAIYTSYRKLYRVN
jgi:hypothetical protein